MIDYGFSEWLAAQRWRTDAVGDLAAEAGCDPWPWDRDDDITVLHTHLARMDAPDAAHDALDRAWTEWERGAGQ